MAVRIVDASALAALLFGEPEAEAVAARLDGALALATATGRTAYDASYLWLARQFGAGLVTLDRQLAKAATLP